MNICVWYPAIVAVVSFPGMMYDSRGYNRLSVVSVGAGDCLKINMVVQASVPALYVDEVYFIAVCRKG